MQSWRKLARKPYGRAIGLFEVIFLLAAAVFAAVLVYGIVKTTQIEWACAAGALVAICGAYVARIVRKMKAELDEIKRQFR